MALAWPLARVTQDGRPGVRTPSTFRWTAGPACRLSPIRCALLTVTLRPVQRDQLPGARKPLVGPSPRVLAAELAHLGACPLQGAVSMAVSHSALRCGMCRISCQDGRLRFATCRLQGSPGGNVGPGRHRVSVPLKESASRRSHGHWEMLYPAARRLPRGTAQGPKAKEAQIQVLGPWVQIQMPWHRGEMGRTAWKACAVGPSPPSTEEWTPSGRQAAPCALTQHRRLPHPGTEAPVPSGQHCSCSVLLLKTPGLKPFSPPQPCFAFCAAP